MFILKTFPGSWLSIAAALTCAFMITGTASADNHGHGPGTSTVNCFAGNGSVQSAIDRARTGVDTTIFIVGPCDERVSISKDGITLSGNKDGAGIIGGGLTEVVVTGAQRVNIEYLELHGDGYGVLVQEGSTVGIRNNNIHDNEADGVGVRHNAFATVEFNTITGNGRIEEFEAGIDVWIGSSVRSRGNIVTDNAYAAVEVGNAAYLRSSDGDLFAQTGCSGNELPGEGVSCGDTPGTVAVDCYRNGVCDFRGTQVIGNSDISGLSNLDVRNSTFNGGIDASGGARLHLRSSVAVYGFVNCISRAFASSFIQCDIPLPPPPF